MEELQRIATYGDFKRELDKTFTGISEGFVRAGYLLKQARDTDILKESGYKSVTEFAAAEYNLTETYVSRFIAINDRYSEGGYSDRLQERYQGYGMTKLAEMLTLPEQLADAIPPELSREEIRDVKREIAEEKKITDLEVMLEGQQDTELFLPARAMKQYFYDNPEKYLEMMQALKKDELTEQEEAAMDILAPSGSAVLMVRLRGVGKLMISIQGMDRDVEIQNVRTLERETVTWSALLDEIFRVYGREALANPEKVWEEVYGEPFPGQGWKESSEEIEQSTEKPKIAPAQAEKPEPIMNEPEPITKNLESITEKPELITENLKPITEGEEKDGTEERGADPEGTGEEPERQQDASEREAEAAPEGETAGESTAGEAQPAGREEPESCCDVATESQGDTVNTEAEVDSAVAEHCQECRFAHPKSQAKKLAYASVCEECTEGSNYQPEKASEGEQESEQEEMQMASDLERQIRRQIMGLTEEIRALVRTVTPAPIEIGDARSVHAAARKLLALADRIMDIKESEQEELEGQMSIEDWENES